MLDNDYHVNGYHGSSKDECIYCRMFDAPEHVVCPVKAQRNKETRDWLSDKASHLTKIRKLIPKELRKTLEGVCNDARFKPVFDSRGRFMRFVHMECTNASS